MEFSFSPVAARNSVFEIDLYVQLMLIVQSILRERDVSGLTEGTNQVTDWYHTHCRRRLSDGVEDFEDKIAGLSVDG